MPRMLRTARALGESAYDERKSAREISPRNGGAYSSGLLAALRGVRVAGTSAKRGKTDAGEDASRKNAPDSGRKDVRGKDAGWNDAGRKDTCGGEIWSERGSLGLEGMYQSGEFACPRGP